MSRLADREALYDMDGAWLSMVLAGCTLAGEERQVKAALLATDYAQLLLCFICSSLHRWSAETATVWFVLAETRFGTHWMCTRVCFLGPNCPLLCCSE